MIKNDVLIAEEELAIEEFDMKATLVTHLFIFTGATPPAIHR